MIKIDCLGFIIFLPSSSFAKIINMLKKNKLFGNKIHLFLFFFSQPSFVIIHLDWDKIV